MAKTSTDSALPHIHLVSLGVAEVVDDVVQSYRLAFEALGHSTSFSRDTISPGTLNVVFFCWNLHWKALESLGPDCIVVNFEHLSEGAQFASASYRELLQRFYIWDYAASNFHRAHTLRYRAADLVPLGHQPGAGDEANPDSALSEDQRDIDVVFFGNTTARRRHIIDALRARGLTVCLPTQQPWSPQERDQYLRRCKVALNMHQFDDSRIVETPRLNILLRQRKAVVCELYPDSELDPDLRAAVEGAPYDELVERTVWLLGQPDRRQALERAAHPTLHARLQTAWVGPALQRYATWRAQQRPLALDEWPSVAALVARPTPGITPPSDLQEQASRPPTTIETSSASTAPHTIGSGARFTQLLLPGEFNRCRALQLSARLVEDDFVVIWNEQHRSAPERLARQAAFLRANADVDVVGSWRAVDGPSGGLTVVQAPELDGEIRAEWLGQGPALHGATCMFRRDLLQTPGLWDIIEHQALDHTDSDDLEQQLLYCCALQGARFAVVPAVLVRSLPRDQGPARGRPPPSAAYRAYIAACFSALSDHQRQLLVDLQGAYWPGEATYALASLRALAQAAQTPTLGMRLERSTLTRTLRHEAVRVVQLYANAGRIDAAWMSACYRDPALATLLAPARHDLPTL